MQGIFSDLRGYSSSPFCCFWWYATTLSPRALDGASIGEIATHPAKYAGHETCETCHVDVLDVKKNGKHAHVNCEACHGAQAKHADDPSTVKPVLPDTAVLCARCHTASAAKPKGFPEVVPEEHSTGLPCETCHNPHSPVIGSDSGASAAKGGAK